MMATTTICGQGAVGIEEEGWADVYGLLPFDSDWNGGPPCCFEARYEVWL